MKEKTLTTNAVRRRPWGRRVRMLLVILPLTLLVVLMFPTEAHAAGFLGIFPDIPAMIKQWFLDMAAGLFNGYNQMISHIADQTILSQPFNTMLGEETYAVVSAVHENAVVPVASGILTLLMLVQLVKISQRIDATSTLPAVKEIVFLAVFFVLFSWFIKNSLAVLTGIYNIVVNDIMPKIGSVATESGFFNGTLVAPDENSVGDVSIGGCFMVLLTALLSYVAGIIAFIVATVVTYARAWQLYVMGAFSSIPVALLGFDETRQSGITFLKNFAACALSGALILFLLAVFPHILSTVALSSAPDDGSSLLLALAGAASAGNVAGSAAGFTILTLFEWVALTILLIIAILKSGSWAKEILGC